MRRILVLVLLVSLLAPGPVLGAPAAKASISDVTLSPSQPAPGERATFTVTIRNGESTAASPSNAFEINQIAIRTRDGRRITYVDDIGTVPEGTTLDVPLTAVFPDAGTREVIVSVYGDTGERLTVLRYPVVVRVREGGPQLSIRTQSNPVVGVEGNATVTVVNGESVPASGLELSLSSESARVDDDTRVLESLAPGEARNVSFDVTPSRARYSLDATLEYRNEGGDVRTNVAGVTREAEPLREDVRLDATVPPGGADPPVTVDVSNLGNAPIEDVVLRARRNGEILASRSVDDVPAGETRTRNLSITDVERANLTVVASYDVGLGTGEATANVVYRANPGRVELTGVDVEREDDRLHLSGSASNVGLSPVDGVVVSVVPTAGVTPARPYREYFVGTIPASDFVSFDLYARVDANATEIPIRVTYLVDGERRTGIQTVPAADLPSPTSDGSRGPSLLVVAGGLAVLAIVVVGLYAYWRRRGRHAATDRRAKDER